MTNNFSKTQLEEFETIYSNIHMTLGVHHEARYNAEEKYYLIKKLAHQLKHNHDLRLWNWFIPDITNEVTA